MRKIQLIKAELERQKKGFEQNVEELRQNGYSDAAAIERRKILVCETMLSFVDSLLEQEEDYDSLLCDVDLIASGRDDCEQIRHHIRAIRRIFKSHPGGDLPQDGTKGNRVQAAMEELEGKIALTKKDGSWDGVDADAFMDELRGGKEVQKHKTCPLFEKCLVDVDPSIRKEVTENIDRILEGKDCNISEKIYQNLTKPYDDMEAYDVEVWNWLKEHGTDENKQLIMMTDRHFTDWQKCKDSSHIQEMCKEIGISFTCQGCDPKKQDAENNPAPTDDNAKLQELVAFLRTGKPYFCPNSQRRQAWAACLERLVASRPQPRFPGESGIIDKVYGPGNLESDQYDDAILLVALAKEELIKELLEDEEKMYEGAKKGLCDKCSSRSDCPWLSRNLQNKCPYLDDVMYGYELCQEDIKKKALNQSE